MKPAIQTLTPDQAAEELALLLDEKFLVEDDPIQLHHWKEKNAQRQMDLEMWLMIHPPAVDETPAPGSAAGRHASEPAEGALTLTDPSLYDGSRAAPINRLPNAVEPAV